MKGEDKDNRRMGVGKNDKKIKTIVGTLILIALTGMFAGVHAQGDDGLVAEWRFDEGSGSIAKDSSGNGNNGTIHGAAWVDGKFGKALSFDGENDYVSVTTPLTNVENTFTMELWVYPLTTHEIDTESTGGVSGTTGQKYAIYPPQGYQVWRSAHHAGAGISVGTNGISVYEHSDFYMPPLLVWQGSIDDWSHVCVVYENKQPRLYVNGILVKAGLTSNKLHVHPGPGVGGSDRNLGSIGGGHWGYFKGIIDEVRIYNRALTPEEIKSHYERKQISYPESSITGSFDLENAAPAVTDFTLYESDESDTTTQMTPQTEYAVKIEVSDANKLEDIAQLKVILKTNTTLLTAGDNVTDKATYKWTASNGWEFVGPGAGGSTWAINASACRQPSDFAATSGTWWLHFVPGKVARESTAATTQRWDIYVKAMDKQSASDEMIKWDYEMMWYGELSAVDTSYEFGDVQLGAENVTITDSDSAINVTTIANGNYKLASKSTNWVNETFGSTAMLDWDGTLSSGEFALKVDGYGSLDSFTYVRDTYTTIQDFSSVSGPTAEAGESRGIYQWLSVASEGLLPGTYKGTYYVQIANG